MKRGRLVAFAPFDAGMNFEFARTPAIPLVD